MSSWRDAASPQAQDDLDTLLAGALPFAQGLLEEHGEFFPYGMSMSLDGEAVMVGAYDGDEQPASLDVLSLLIDGLRSDRDLLRAAALVADVRIEGSDAIRVELEHREGVALTVLVPYQAKRLPRRVEYGEVSADATPPRIWPSPAARGNPAGAG